MKISFQIELIAEVSHIVIIPSRHMYPKIEWVGDSHINGATKKNESVDLKFANTLDTAKKL